MSAKELKTLIELATSVGYTTGDEFKQFVDEERKKWRINRRERERERERERASA